MYPRCYDCVVCRRSFSPRNDSRSVACRLSKHPKYDTLTIVTSKKLVNFDLQKILVSDWLDRSCSDSEITQEWTVPLGTNWEYEQEHSTTTVEVLRPPYESGITLRYGFDGIVFHESCWQLLRKFFAPDQVPLIRIFEIFDSVPFDGMGYDLCWDETYINKVKNTTKERLSREYKLPGLEFHNVDWTYDTKYDDNTPDLKKFDIEDDAGTSDFETDDSESDTYRSDVEADDGTSDTCRSDVEADDVTSDTRRSDVKADDGTSDTCRSDVEAHDVTSDTHRSDVKADDVTSDTYRSDVEADDVTSDPYRSDIEAGDYMLKLYRKNDCFGRLPKQLLETIIINLDISTALRMRLVSKAFLPVLTSQVFWASRFLRGNERGYYFEEAENMSIDKWDRLYRATADKRLSFNGQVRLWMWRMIQDISTLARLQLSRPDNNPRTTNAVQSMQWLNRYRVVGKVIAESEYESSHSFREGCREFGTQIALVPNDLLAVSVTTTSVGGTTYIAGICLIPRIGPYVRLGYASNEGKHLLRVTSLEGFVLAVGLRGIHALRIVGRDKSLSHWIGCPLFSPVTERLTLEASLDCLKVGFDVSQNHFLSIA